MYQLLSHDHNSRIRLKTLCGGHEGDTGVPSSVGIFNAANWLEREVGTKPPGEGDAARSTQQHAAHNARSKRSKRTHAAHVRMHARSATTHAAHSRTPHACTQPHASRIRTHTHS